MKEDSWRIISGVNWVCFVVIFALNNSFILKNVKIWINDTNFLDLIWNTKKGIA